MSDTPPPSGSGAKEAKAELKAAKARDKAMRPWFKKKRFVIPLILLVLVIGITAASGGGESEDPSVAVGDDEETATTDATGEEPAAEEPAEETTTTEPGPTELYPDRVDRQKEDKEAAVGESVQLSGYTATLVGASIQPEDMMTDSKYLITVNVKIENRDDRAQPYNTFDWKIQTPNGQVLDPTYVGEQTLGSGDLVEGGSVEGNVSFDAGPGTYYIIYKPDAFDAARGIWQITV